MRYRNLGASGLKISELILGTATFGELIDEPVVRRVVDAALDHGITTFDTGDAYAQGASESLLGAALTAKRDKVVICTKVGLRVGDSEADHAMGMRGGYDHAARWTRGIAPNEQGLSRAHIHAAVDASLRRLRTDYIDLYQVHRWDDETPIEETLDALDDLVRAGKVRYIGCSAYAGWQLMRALWASADLGLSRFQSLQVAYNLLVRDAEREVLPAAQAGGVGALAFQALAGGVLTGRYDEATPPAAGTRLGTRETYRTRYWNPQSFAMAKRLCDMALASGGRPEALALGWVLANPAVNAVIIGAESVEDIANNAQAVERPLDPDTLAAFAGSRGAPSAAR